MAKPNGQLSLQMAKALFYIRYVLFDTYRLRHLFIRIDSRWYPVPICSLLNPGHQRKMMFALVMLCRTGTPATVLDEVCRLKIHCLQQLTKHDQLFGLTTVHIPKMPALGLLLEHPVYNGYNAKITKLNETLDTSDPDYREPVEFEKYSKEMNAFKKQYIYDNMRGIEDRKGL